MNYSFIFTPMKIPGFILAFYLALLSVVPCCAFDDCPDDKAATEQASHQSGDEDDCGTCSPFFNCTGCACVSIHPEATTIAIYSLQEKKSYTGFIDSSPVHAQYDVWQPPKIG
jgi:hypothetical protein